MKNIPTSAIFIIIVVIIVLLIAIAILYFLKESYLKDEHPSEHEEANYLNDVEDKDILNILKLNRNEIREYYKINKAQAKKSFNMALSLIFISILFISFATITYVIYPSTEIPKYITIFSSVMHLGGIALAYTAKHSVNQVNKFFESLIMTEKIVTSIYLAKKVSSENRDRVYEIMINSLLAQKTQS